MELENDDFSKQSQSLQIQNDNISNSTINNTNIHQNLEKQNKKTNKKQLQQGETESQSGSMAQISDDNNKTSKDTKLTKEKKEEMRLQKQIKDYIQKNDLKHSFHKMEMNVCPKKLKQKIQKNIDEENLKEIVEYAKKNNQNYAEVKQIYYHETFYKVGDVVLIKNDCEGESDYIGLIKKIIAVRIPKAILIVELNWFYKKNEVDMRKNKKYFDVIGQNEIFLTDHQDYQHVECLNGLGTVLNFQEYDSLKKIEDNVFYTRAIYDVVTKNFKPPIEKWGEQCVCKKPMNPDILMIFCESCKVWYHTKCIKMKVNESKKIETYVCKECIKKGVNVEEFIKQFEEQEKIRKEQEKEKLLQKQKLKKEKERQLKKLEQDKIDILKQMKQQQNQQQDSKNSQQVQNQQQLEQEQKQKQSNQQFKEPQKKQKERIPSLNNTPIKDQEQEQLEEKKKQSQSRIERNKKREEIQDQIVKEYQEKKQLITDEHKIQLDKIQSEYQQQLQDLKNKYQKGLINSKQFLRQKNSIQNNYEKKKQTI